MNELTRRFANSSIHEAAIDFRFRCDSHPLLNRSMGLHRHKILLAATITRARFAVSPLHPAARRRTAREIGGIRNLHCKQAHVEYHRYSPEASAMPKTKHRKLAKTARIRSTFVNSRERVGQEVQKRRVDLHARRWLATDRLSTRDFRFTFSLSRGLSIRPAIRRR